MRGEPKYSRRGEFACRSNACGRYPILGNALSRIYTSTGWKAQLLCLRILNSDRRDRSPPLGDVSTSALAKASGEKRLDLSCVAAHGMFGCDVDSSHSSLNDLNWGGSCQFQHMNERMPFYRSRFGRIMIDKATVNQSLKTYCRVAASVSGDDRTHFGIWTVNMPFLRCRFAAIGANDPLVNLPRLGRIAANVQWPIAILRS